jgi:hypothetical protein
MQSLFNNFYSVLFRREKNQKLVSSKVALFFSFVHGGLSAPFGHLSFDYAQDFEPDSPYFTHFEKLNALCLKAHNQAGFEPNPASI